MSTLVSLRGAISRIEAAGVHDAARAALGHADADETLKGGLMRGALHEVFAPETRQAAAATGFVAALAGRLASKRAVMWVRQDFVGTECGALSMSGLAELGLDPRQLVVVHAADGGMALRVAADALACDALGAVVLDLWGEVRAFDAVASRKLTLAAQTSGVTCLMLRTSAQPNASTAETRWVVRGAPSPSHAPAFGAPVFEAELVRNRHGQLGRWIMEWNCDERLFREVTTTHPQPLAAAPANRPNPAALARLDDKRRRAG